MQEKSIRIYDVAFVSFATAFLVVSSWICLPVGSIPITFQTFAVCVAAGVLGAKKSTVAVTVYMLFGIVGLPVFSGFRNGLGVLAGATGGYVLGFLLTSFVAGFLAKKTGKLFLSYLIGILCCYVFGTAWYMIFYLDSVSLQSIVVVFSACVLPFIVPDIIKCYLAVCVTKAINERGMYENNR